MNAALRACCLALFASLSNAAVLPGSMQASSGDIPLAPDGKRGFGNDLEQRRLTDLLRSKDESDCAFLQELTQLSITTRVHIMSVRQHYVERGYFKFLPAVAGENLGQLHSAYALASASPARELAAKDGRSKALAAMLVDTKFNVRRDLIKRAEVAVQDLDRARSVFGATVVGYASVSLAEVQHVAARADLAAAELRALRSDLDVLTPSEADKEPSAEDAGLSQRLLEIGRIPDERTRADALRAALASRLELERRMQPMLFSVRVEPRLTALRQWRDRSLESAADARAKVLELLPDTPEGDKPSPEIARLKKSQRMEQAGALAREAMANDPLDPDLVWAAGHALHFAWPGLESVALFDRFLALEGLRTSDANPGNGRKLTPREAEAYAAVVAFRH